MHRWVTGVFFQPGGICTLQMWFCVCVCVCVCVIISLYGWGYLCVRWYGVWLYVVLFVCFGVFFFLFFKLLSWMLQNDCLDNCCSECLISYKHVFYMFVFAPVQCNWACFTWKGTLEIRSLLLLLFCWPGFQPSTWVICSINGCLPVQCWGSSPREWQEGQGQCQHPRCHRKLIGN